MMTHIREHAKSCDRCQIGKHCKQKYGKLPPKRVELIPWKTVCVNLIGPYTVEAKDGTISDFLYLTMIDPVTGWFKIIEFPNTKITYLHVNRKIRPFSYKQISYT